MSMQDQRSEAQLQSLLGVRHEPEEPVELFTSDAIQSHQDDCLAILSLQMPSFIRDDEDIDAMELFFL